MARKPKKFNSDGSLNKARLKYDAWELLSKAIRLEARDKAGNVICVTCGKMSYWKADGMQAGHFIAGRTAGVLWDERNIAPQCYKCNMHLGGAVLEYRDYMLSEYGEEVIEELRLNRNKEVMLTRDDYLQMIEGYKARIIAQGETP